MKTKLLAASLILLSGLSASGKDVYFFKDRAADSFLTVADVNKITFSATAVELSGACGVTEMAYSDFSAFAFADKRTVGVGLTAAQQGIKVASNAQGLVTVRSNAAIDAIAVYSVSGSLVTEYMPQSSDFEFAIASQGIYMVKVTSGNNQGVFKIVKR